MWNEAKIVGSSLQTEVELFRIRNITARKRMRFHDEDTPEENVNETDESSEEVHFRKHIFYVILDNITGGLTVRFSAEKQISDTFSFLFLRNYQKMSEEELKCKAATLAEEYSKDISRIDLVQEMNHITIVHNANFGRKQLGALELLNALSEYKL